MNSLLTYKEKFHIGNENLKEEDFNKCIILVILSSYSISYIIYHNLWNKFVLLDITEIEDYTKFDIISYLSQKNIYLKHFRNSILCYDIPEFLILDDKYSSSDLNPSFFNILYGQKPGYEILVDSIFEYNLNFMYRIHATTHFTIIRNYLYSDYWHMSSLVMKSFLKKMATLDKTKNLVKVILQNNSLILFLYYNKKCYFLQEFIIETIEDVVFQISNLVKLKNLSLNNSIFYFSGYNFSNLENIEYYKKFFPNIVVEKCSSSFTYDKKFSNYPNHYFAPLFELFLSIL